jgi:outer membrane protein OmpA-like peptidoglycan-associated protein
MTGCHAKESEGMKIITMRNHFKTTSILSFIFCYFIMMGFLQGCASSDAARGAASETDKAYLQTDYALRHVNEGGTLTNAYQNTSQTTKGLIIGGALGAAAGSTSGIGTAAGLGLGAIFGGAIGSYIDSHTTLNDKLENRHVQVIVLGDQVLIIIPSYILFYDNSYNIRADTYDTLDMVIQYISQYPNMSIKVAAYTSAAQPDSVARALSQQQAENIVKYLWNRRVNTRVLYAEGNGGSKLVTANMSDWNSANYRVEITLEKLPT